MKMAVGATTLPVKSSRDQWIKSAGRHELTVQKTLGNTSKNVHTGNLDTY